MSFQTRHAALWGRVWQGVLHALVSLTSPSCTVFSRFLTSLLAPHSQPIGAEYDLETKHPQAAATLVNISQYQTHMDELRETLTPEIELIDSRIVGPANEFQTVLKSIRKNMTKRDHKVRSKYLRLCPR